MRVSSFEELHPVLMNHLHAALCYCQRALVLVLDVDKYFIHITYDM